MRGRTGDGQRSLDASRSTWVAEVMGTIVVLVAIWALAQPAATAAEWTQAIAGVLLPVGHVLRLSGAEHRRQDGQPELRNNAAPGVCDRREQSGHTRARLGKGRAPQPDLGR
jgi:hypothetical protein